MVRKTASRRSRILLVFAVIILLFAFLMLFGEILLQEGNPFPVLRSAIQLELSGADVVPVAGEGILYIQKAGSEEPLTDYLSGYGWAFSERLGSSIFYERNGETLYADSRMLTRRYVVYELDQHPDE